MPLTGRMPPLWRLKRIFNPGWPMWRVARPQKVFVLGRRQYGCWYCGTELERRPEEDEDGKYIVFICHFCHTFMVVEAAPT